MQKDLFGNIRFRINFHMHTTLSDGNLTPAQAAKMYKEAGYDAVAFTDHWLYGGESEYEGMLILSGAEYNRGNESHEGVWHIVGVGMTRQPSIVKTGSAQSYIDAIHKAGGVAILAHPAWSLNTPERIMKLKNIDATEIYNSVSDVGMSRRADSSLLVDALGGEGMLLPLVAADDTHYYVEREACFAWTMVKAENLTRGAILQALRRRDFYATQGPEIHLRKEGQKFVVDCSPCREIRFWSNAAWTKRIFTGDKLTHAEYVPKELETFVRAEVVDENGLRAWSNPLPVAEEAPASENKRRS